MHNLWPVHKFHYYSSQYCSKVFNNCDKSWENIKNYLTVAGRWEHMMNCLLWLCFVFQFSWGRDGCWMRLLPASLWQIQGSEMTNIKRKKKRNLQRILEWTPYHVTIFKETAYRKRFNVFPSFKKIMLYRLASAALKCVENNSQMKWNGVVEMEFFICYHQKWFRWKIWIEWAATWAAEKPQKVFYHCIFAHRLRGRE